MVDNGYSDSFNEKNVSQEEINYFEQDIEPGLIRMAEESPDYEQWLAQNFSTEDINFEGITTMGLLKESLGPIDLLFLILGVGTAFRLARNE